MKKTEVIDSALDQTQFIEDSAFIEKDEVRSDTEPVKKNNKTYILMGLAIASFLIVSSLVLLIIFKPKTISPEDISVQVDSVAKQIGPLERQLMILERDIENADPLETSLSFPPVNFKLDLKDATSLVQ